MLVKHACNGKYTGLQAYVGDLTFGDLNGLVGNLGIAEIVRTTFPAELRLAAMSFLLNLSRGNWSYDTPKNQESLNFSQKLVSDEAYKFFRDCLSSNNKTLKQLDVSQNKITEDIAICILQLPNLEKLNLTDCDLSELPQHVVEALRKI